MNLTFNFWDIVLIVVASLQSTAMAYLYAPRWKALLLSLPLPFTVATLSLGRPVDAMPVAGLLLLLAFTHMVRWLHQKRKVPIIPAIAASALMYCVVASVLALVIPATPCAFWIACACAVVVATYVHFSTSHREEPGQRTNLPVWIKWPIVCGVVIGIVMMKKCLLGFMAMFPMVGVVAAYEARSCLWTICRQIPVFMVPMTLMLCGVRLTQDHLGSAGGLAVGWGVFVIAFAAILWWRGSEQGTCQPGKP